MCAVTVICGEDDAHAQRLAAPVRVAIANTRTGKRAPIPTIEEALAHTFTAQEQVIVDDFLQGAVIGGPELVRDRLQALAADLQADEVMVSSLVPGHQERCAALARIARAMF
jgi:alkanesulfonate monooxygenase SsuD/methylene tetrahydromethanopterin reductase-like flavin-dependent oxidoreductase (luciferase family)